jgi:hypothetical protein
VRTTIEMKPDHRTRLLEIASRRGEKGFSSVVAEAIDSYLQADAVNTELRKRALCSGRSLSKKEAETIRRRAAKIRANWR